MTAWGLPPRPGVVSGGTGRGGVLGAVLLAVAVVAAPGIAAALPGPVLALAGVAGLCGVVAAGLLSPAWSVAIISFVVFTRLAAAVGSDRIGYALLALGLATLVCLSHPMRKRADRVVPFGAVAALYASVTLLGALWADRPDLVRDEGIVLVAQVAVCVGVIACVRGIRELRAATWALLISGALVGALSLRQYVLKDYDNDVFGMAQSSVAQIVGDNAEYRAGGPVGDANFFGQVMCVVVALAVAQAINVGRRSLRACAAAIAVLATATVVITYSRGALVALVVAAMLAIARARRPGVVLTAFSIVLLIVAVVLPANYTARIAEVGQAATVLASDRESVDEPAIRGRMSSWVVAGRMFADHPVTGVGAGNYKGRYLEYSAMVGADKRGEARSAHSLPLQVLAEQGLLGGGAFAALVLGAFLSIRRTTVRLRQQGRSPDVTVLVGLRDGLIVYLVASAFLHAAYPQLLFLLLALAWASPLCVDEVRPDALETVDATIGGDGLGDRPALAPVLDR